MPLYDMMCCNLTSFNVVWCDMIGCDTHHIVLQYTSTWLICIVIALNVTDETFKTMYNPALIVIKSSFILTIGGIQDGYASEAVDQSPRISLPNHDNLFSNSRMAVLSPPSTYLTHKELRRGSRTCSASGFVECIHHTFLWSYRVNGCLFGLHVDC